MTCLLARLSKFATELQTCFPHTWWEGTDTRTDCYVVLHQTKLIWNPLGRQILRQSVMMITSYLIWNAEDITEWWHDCTSTPLNSSMPPCSEAHHFHLHASTSWVKRSHSSDDHKSLPSCLPNAFLIIVIGCMGSSKSSSWGCALGQRMDNID